MPIRNAEQYQLVYYKRGTEYKPHFDSFDFETEDGKKNWEPGGQRMITVIAYLNDVKEGGETGFPELGINVPPCLLYTSPSPRDATLSRMPSSA